MTQSKNIELTPEEQDEIAKRAPQLLEAIKKGSPAAAGWLASWRREYGQNRPHSIAEMAQKQAEEIRREVAAAIEASGPEQGQITQWCGFPTDMTRCSPFFPLNAKELGERRFLENYRITSANWGEILYLGPQLSTYEEDSLLALLAVLDVANYYRKDSFAYEEFDKDSGLLRTFLTVYENKDDAPVEAKRTYTYKGPALPLLRILHGKRIPSKQDYAQLIRSLELMTVAGVKIAISTGKTKSGKRRSPRIIQMSAMLAGVKWDDKNKELTATINPFFYETYMDGRVTLMDVAKRMTLKGLNAKALYRFVQSHRQNPVFAGHFLTLADALNMDREQPAKEVRRNLKTAINELIRQSVLTKKSGFVDTDIIKLERASGTLPAQKKINP